MTRVFRITGLLLLLMSASCLSADRRNDLGDVFGASLAPSLGFEAAVGPITAGAGAFVLTDGSYYGESPERSVSSATFLVGAFCDYGLHGQYVGNGFDLGEVPASYVLRRKQSCVYSDDEEGERKFAAYQYGRLRLSLGFIYGFTLEFNWLEVIDAVAGIGGYDPLDDDMHRYYAEMAKEPSAP